MPGPGAYDAHSVSMVVDNSPFVSFPKEKKGLNLSFNDVPGPGAYTQQRKADASPQWKFGSQSKDTYRPSEAPGPGAYEAKAPKSKGGAAIITSRHSVEKKEAVPGPGTYEPTLGKKAPQYSVGSGPRGDLSNRAGEPGPGQYEADRPSSATAPK